jgi:hypothetical protein
MLQVSANEVIDATRIGSRMRFVNHSCSPNCRVEKWCVRGRERCGLFAARRISAGDEVTFDYQFHCFTATVRHGYLLRLCTSASCCNGTAAYCREQSSAFVVLAIVGGSSGRQSTGGLIKPWRRSRICRLRHRVQRR